MRREREMKILLLGSLLTLTAQANAQNSIQKLISEKTVAINVRIDSKNVKLSKADYALPTVKVLIPELAEHTLMDHRNTGEGAPCMATDGTRDPNKVIQNKHGIDRAEIKIKLTQHLFADVENNICYVSLSEELETDIRGFKFVHVRDTALPNREIEDCK